MKKTTIILFLVGLLLIGGLWFFQYWNATVEENTDIVRVGAVISQTGPAAENGQNIMRGLELAKKDLASRGIDVKIDYQDDQTDPKQSISAVASILSVNRPDFFVGPIWSFLLDASLPAFNNAKIVTYSPCSTSEYINTKSDYVFYGYIRNSLKMKPTQEWLETVGAKNVAVIVSQDSWGNSVEKAYMDAIEQAGGKAVLVERVPFGAGKDVTPTILAKVKAAKADAILWTGYDGDAIELIRRMQDNKMHLPVLGTDTLRLAKTKGQVFISPEDSFYVFDTPKDAAFGKKFEKEYGVAPSECADTAYDGLILMAEAKMKLKGEKTLDSYLREKTDYFGYAHTYDFDLNGDITGGKWLVSKI